MNVPPEKILVATDGSEGAARAARAAVLLTEKTGARLHVAHAWRPPSRRSGYPAGAWTDHAHLEEREARRILASQVDLIEGLGRAVSGTHLLQGSPVDALLDLCEELDPGIMFMGDRGLGPVRDLPVGGVTERVANHARRPVVVVRGGSGAWPPERMVVGDDGSDDAGKAAALSVEIGGLFGAEVVLVRAYRNPATPVGGWSPRDLRRLDEMRNRREKELMRRTESFEEVLGRRPETKLVEGDATLALLIVAGEGEGLRTLLAVGGRGADSTGRRKLGGVPANLLKAAGCSVLISPSHP